MYISIGKVATLLGVAVSTLRRWDNNGKLLADYKTIGKHRRYNSQTILQYIEKHSIQQQPVQNQLPKTVIVYCRVSGSKQKKDLETQQTFLEQYVQQHQWKYLKTFKDIGSGIKDTRQNLLRMIREIPILQPDYLVISYPDRLARFGLAILKQVCQLFDVQIITAKIDTTTISPEQQLVNDVLAILTSFAGRIHRARRGTLQ